jgi:hypothetical protein
MRLNQNLVTLLRDIGERANEEDKKVIREALGDVRLYPRYMFFGDIASRP